MAFQPYVPAFVENENEDLSLLEEIQETKNEISHFIDLVGDLADKEEDEVSLSESPSRAIYSPAPMSFRRTPKKRKIATLEEEEDDTSFLESSILEKSFSEINYFNEEKLKQLDYENQKLQSSILEKDSAFRELQLLYEEEKLKSTSLSSILKHKKEELQAKEENIKKIQALSQEKEKFYTATIKKKEEDINNSYNANIELENKIFALNSEIMKLKSESAHQSKPFFSQNNNTPINNNKDVEFTNLKRDYENLQKLYNDLSVQFEKYMKEGFHLSNRSTQNNNSVQISSSADAELNSIIQSVKGNMRKEMEFNKILSENTYLKSAKENEEILKLQLEEEKSNLQKLHNRNIELESQIIQLRKYQHLIDDFSKLDPQLLPESLRNIEHLTQYINKLKYQIEIFTYENSDMASQIAVNKVNVTRLEEENKTLQNRITVLQNQMKYEESKSKIMSGDENDNRNHHGNMIAMSPSFPSFLIPNPDQTKLLHLKASPPLSPEAALVMSNQSSDETLRKQLQDLMKQNMQYKTKSNELIQFFRKITFHILGWQIDVLHESGDRVVRIQSKEKNSEGIKEEFKFNKMQDEFGLIETESTMKFEKNLMDQLVGRGGFPALLAHVQLSLSPCN